MLQARMALAVLMGIDPSPLGQLVRYEMVGFRSASFRFDDASEPVAAHRFIAASDQRPDDFLVELRDAAEAPIPFAPGVECLTVAAFGADGLRPHWSG